MVLCSFLGGLGSSRGSFCISNLGVVEGIQRLFFRDRADNVGTVPDIAYKGLEPVVRAWSCRCVFPGPTLPLASVASQRGRSLRRRY